MRALQVLQFRQTNQGDERQPVTGAVILDDAKPQRPEGGWTEEERSAFVQARWTQVTLGPLILRAETAALAALAVIQSGWLLHSSIDPSVSS